MWISLVRRSGLYSPRLMDVRVVLMVGANVIEFVCRVGSGDGSVGLVLYKMARERSVLMRKKCGSLTKAGWKVFEIGDFRLKCGLSVIVEDISLCCVAWLDSYSKTSCTDGCMSHHHSGGKDLWFRRWISLILAKDWDYH